MIIEAAWRGGELSVWLSPKSILIQKYRYLSNSSIYRCLAYNSARGLFCMKAMRHTMVRSLCKRWIAEKYLSFIRKHHKALDGTNVCPLDCLIWIALRTANSKHKIVRSFSLPKTLLIKERRDLFSETAGSWPFEFIASNFHVCRP